MAFQLCLQLQRRNQDLTVDRLKLQYQESNSGELLVLVSYSSKLRTLWSPSHPIKLYPAFLNIRKSELRLEHNFQHFRLHMTFAKRHDSLQRDKKFQKSKAVDPTKHSIWHCLSVQGSAQISPPLFILTWNLR